MRNGRISLTMAQFKVSNGSADLAEGHRELISSILPSQAESSSSETTAVFELFALEPAKRQAISE